MQHRLRLFWKDLKRRQIFSAGAFYVVGAWAVVQVASIGLPAFGAPAWAMRAVLVAAFAGFPVALVLTWVFDVNKHGIEVTEDADAPPSARNSRKWIRPLIAAPLLALIVGGTAWLWTSRLATTGDTEFTQQMRPDELPVVAVLPLENLTGHKELGWIGDAVSTLVRDDLSQSRLIAVVSAARSARLASEHKDMQGLFTAAADAGITHVLTGEVLRTPKGLTVTSRLTDLRRNVESGGNREEGLDPEQTMSLSTKIAGVVKQTLGLPGTEQVDVFAADFASHNIAAYEAFIAGMENFLNFDYAGAKQAFAAAVQKAPDFAMARYRLAHTLAALGDTDGAIVQVGQAKRDAARLSERERSYIDAGAHYFKREYVEAERGYREILQQHPYESEARLLLIYVLDATSRYDEALVEAEALAAQDPGDEVAWSEIADLNLKLKHYDAATDALHKLLAITPDNPNAHYLLGDSNFFQRKFDDAAREYSRALQLDPGFGDSTLQLAHIDIYKGHPEQAIARLRSLLASSSFSAAARIPAAFELASLLRARNDCTSAMQALDQVHDEISTEKVRIALELAARSRCALEAGHAVGARQLGDEAVGKSPGNTTRYLLARGMAELAGGDIAATRGTIAAIRKLAPVGSGADRPESRGANYLQGLLDLKLGDANAAVTALRLAVQGDGVQYDLYQVALARALAAAGEMQEAKAIAGKAAKLPEPADFKIELEPGRQEAARLLAQWGR